MNPTDVMASGLAAPGGELSLWSMFWGAHFIEGTFITPLVQDESVDLPPVLTIFSTLAFTVLFGPSGVLLASPIVLVIMTGLQVFYLEGHLEKVEPAPKEKGPA